jgi:flagellar assembly protein FliH
LAKEKERNLSDKTKKDNNDGFSTFGPENLEVYHTKEFDDARSFSGDEDSFTELDISSSEDSFVPLGGSDLLNEFVENEQNVPDTKDSGSESEIKAPPVKTKGGEKKEKARLDALSAVVEQEKNEAYDKGFEDGKSKAKEELEKKIKEENQKSAEDEKARGFEKGKQEGYEEGKKEGIEEARKSLDETNEKFIELMDTLSSSWKNVIDRYEEEIVDLSLKMAAKVLYSNLTLDSDFVKLAIKEALKDIPDPLNVTIGVNPEDYNIIEMIKEDFFQRFEKLKNITIISDPSIGRGGCTIDSETGTVVQTIENRLKELESQILKNASSKRNA